LCGGLMDDIEMLIPEVVENDNNSNNSNNNNNNNKTNGHMHLKMA